MRTFDEMVNGPKQETRTFSDMAKSTYQGKGKRVGTKGNYRYIYDNDKKSKPSNKKEGMFSKLFGGMKKLFGKKPTPSSREKLEKLATDKGMLSSIAKLTDLKALSGLRDMLLAHGAEEKKPRAAAEPSEPVESEDNFETMPEADPEPKERKERKTNPLNKLLALVNKRIGQLEAEKPEKKDEPKAEGKKVVRVYKLGESKTVSFQEEIMAALEQMGLSTEMLDERQGEGRSRTVDLSVKVTGDADKIDSVMNRAMYRLGTTLESEDNFDTMPESNAQGTQSTKDADAAHPEDRHEEVPDRKTRGLGEHNDKLSNIILDGKPLSDDTEFLDHLEVDDYPYGRQRTTAKFTIETDKQGRQRAVMQTVNPKTGRENKPKKATYAGSVKFFMHEGKTYVVEHSDAYGSIHIRTVAGGFRPATMKDPDTGRVTGMIAANMGNQASDEHPAGYMSLYEAATGKPAPKVQDFKDARKRMEDRREAQRQKIAKEVDEQGKANLREAVGLGAGATDAETQERVDAIREGKASMVDGKYVEKPESPAEQASDFVESNKPENRTKTAKDTVMKFLTEKRRNQTAMVSLLGAYDDGGGYSLQLKQAKTGTLTAIVTRPDGSQSAKKLPKGISATAPQDIHKIALEHHADVSAKDQKRIKARQDRLDKAAKAVADLPPAPLTASFNPDTVAMKSSEKHGKEALNTDSHKYLSEYVSKDTSRTALAHVRHAQGVSVATDGHRLVIVPTDRTTDEAILVPGKGIKAQYDKTPSALKKEHESFQGHSAYFEENRMSFPIHHHFIPQGGTSTTVSAEHIAKIADLAQAHSAKDDSRLGRVVLEVDEGGGVFARVERNPTVTESPDEDYPGKKPIQVGVTDKEGISGTTTHINARFLKASLKGVKKGASVQMTFNGGLDPLMIDHESGIKHIVMPLRP